MTNYRNRIGEAIAFARNVAGRSQQELADMLGRDKRTIQKWERGEIRIALEDFLDVFDTLHLPVGPYEMWILHPELFPRGMEDIKGFSTEKKRRTLADYYLHQAAPLEIEQEYYILFGDHGSNSCGIRQELLANLQTPLRDRKRIVNQIIDNYYEARAIGHLTDPEGQQPVMPILEACYDASARSVKANENGTASAASRTIWTMRRNRQKSEPNSRRPCAAACCFCVRLPAGKYCEICGFLLYLSY